MLNKILNYVDFDNNNNNGNNNEFKLSRKNNKNIYLIITGIYGVGKSTIVNMILKLLEKKIYANINLSENNIEKMTDILGDTGQELKLILIEVNINLLSCLLAMMDGETYYLINIVPKNIDRYKNKLINKIFVDIKTKSNNFIRNIGDVIDDTEKLSEHIEIIINSDKSVLSIDDFIFLNKPINKLINNGKMCKSKNSSYEILDVEF